MNIYKMLVADPDGDSEKKSACLFLFYFNFIWNIESNLNRKISFAS